MNNIYSIQIFLATEGPPTHLHVLVKGRVVVGACRKRARGWSRATRVGDQVLLDLILNNNDEDESVNFGEQNEGSDFFSMLKSAQRPLYEGYSEFSELLMVLELMRIKKIYPKSVLIEYVIL
ncbi:hypothetical protein ACFE04_005189 [Oxalis oulophora]